MKANRNRSHAAKVAAVATTIVMGCYVIGVVVLNLSVVNRLTTEVDARLSQRLAAANRLALPVQGAGHTGSSRPGERGSDIDDAPSFLWTVTAAGAVTALTNGAPPLPSRSWSADPTTITVGSTQFRFRAVKLGPDWLVAGQSVANVRRVRNVLWAPELIFGGALLVAVFGGALMIGLRASAPLELVRRRQAEFTADASHELRTPLSVIEAEVDLALTRRRNVETYEAALQRIAGEGRRLRRIVDDLLWLARADGENGEKRAGVSSNLADVAAACTDRFQAVSERLGVALSFHQVGDGPLMVSAPPEGIDRLTGVLVDNACKHAGEGGRVEVRVRAVGNRVGLEVDDSGAGIPPDEVPLIFDRFHRATESPGGTGLGLAIADSVVRSTQGTWSVGRSRLGGARMEVWWRRVTPRRGSVSAGERSPGNGWSPENRRGEGPAPELDRRATSHN